MSTGTTAPGAQSEAQAAQWVRRMFDGVAPRYDLLNHLLSFNVDRYWRRQTVRALQAQLANPEARIVDLCCGSGDLMLALQKASPARVLGSDFSHQMLRTANEKIARRNVLCKVFEADALTLPLASGSCDVVTAAFGFRNLANYRRGLDELLRVLRPGGTAAILEFTTPPNAAFRSIYNFYSNKLLPVIGGIVSGSREAYTYLPESVRKFPDAPTLAAQFQQAGFTDVRYQYLTFGIVALHIGTRPILAR
ncbi:MAG: bifunctional demethylmenaquinone methyltransferase/2-methoxy-6-polyprenyl-1,4-benzoquinol methylase UbiE [Bryobacterales bacterium]|nr:bifunctional demethylmenaquinone methyltransferase/2-methoxy-6-polyprenyl-1,4-benzoquinol methylase UbiE [Bryobacterales bacterium]